MANVETPQEAHIMDIAEMTIRPSMEEMLWQMTISLIGILEEEAMVVPL